MRQRTAVDGVQRLAGRHQRARARSKVCVEDGAAVADIAAGLQRHGSPRDRTHVRDVVSGGIHHGEEHSAIALQIWVGRRRGSNRGPIRGVGEERANDSAREVRRVGDIGDSGGRACESAQAEVCERIRIDVAIGHNACGRRLRSIVEAESRAGQRYQPIAGIVQHGAGRQVGCVGTGIADHCDGADAAQIVAALVPGVQVPQESAARRQFGGLASHRHGGRIIPGDKRPEVGRGNQNQLAHQGRRRR